MYQRSCNSAAVTFSRVSGEGKKEKWREKNCKNTFVLCRVVSKQCGQSETEFPWNKIPESLRLERPPRSWSSTVTPSSMQWFPLDLFLSPLFYLLGAGGRHNSLVFPRSSGLVCLFKKEEIVQWEKNVSPVVVVGLFLLLERIPKVLMLNKTFLQWPLLRGLDLDLKALVVIFPLPLGNENVFIWKGTSPLKFSVCPLLMAELCRIHWNIAVPVMFGARIWA